MERFPSGYARASRPVPSRTKGSSDPNFDGEEELRQEAKRLLAEFGFTPPQKRELWEAFKRNPDGVERCAQRARAIGSRDGTRGTGLLLAMVRGGDHLVEIDRNAQRVTGWRFVRGSHSGSYVEDPNGVDKLPAGYDFTTTSPFSPGRTMPNVDRDMERLEPVIEGSGS